MSDLVRELRELAKVWTAAFHGRADILTEAADEIARLTAEVERLCDQSEFDRDQLRILQSVIDEDQVRIKKLQAVVDAARTWSRTDVDAAEYPYVWTAFIEALRALDGEP